MSYRPMWICTNCHKEVPVESAEEIKWMNITNDFDEVTYVKQCECSGNLVFHTESSMASRDGHYMCLVTKDYTKTLYCPREDCPEVENCPYVNKMKRRPNLTYKPVWYCEKCKATVPIDDEKELRSIEFELTPNYKPCSCGGTMRFYDGDDMAKKNGRYMCSTTDDYTMMAKCPTPECPHFQNCYRLGFKVNKE